MRFDFKPVVYSQTVPVYPFFFDVDLLSVGLVIALELYCNVLPQNCNCNCILFTKLPWPGDGEGTFRFSSQAATCPPVYHTQQRLHTLPLIAERQARKL